MAEDERECLVACSDEKLSDSVDSNALTVNLHYMLNRSLLSHSPGAWLVRQKARRVFSVPRRPRRHDLPPSVQPHGRFRPCGSFTSSDRPSRPLGSGVHSAGHTARSSRLLGLVIYELCSAGIS